jgi:ribonuclease J
MLRNTEIAGRLGLMAIDEDVVIPIEAIGDHEPSEVAVVCTGAQGEPFAALSLMAAGDHRWVKVGVGDTILISAKPIPGNEMKVSRVINGLLRRGAAVFHGNNAPVHVSGHGAQEELKTFMNVVRPRAFVPIHGEYRHLRAHADLARQMRIPEVFLCEDGDRLILDGGEIAYEHRAVPAGHVFVDGLEVGTAPRGVVRDRRHLAEDGVIVVTVVVDGRTGEIVQGPDLESHGFIADPADVFAEAAAAVRQEVEGFSEWPADLDAVRRHIKGAVNRVTRARTARRAVVVPIVLEI